MKKANKKSSGSVKEQNIKAVVALLILALGWGLLLLFKNYQENIILAGNFSGFIALVVAGLTLLVCLFYLVNKK
jgi:hypothetical protein